MIALLVLLIVAGAFVYVVVGTAVHSYLEGAQWFTVGEEAEFCAGIFWPLLPVVGLGYYFVRAALRLGGDLADYFDDDARAARKIARKMPEARVVSEGES